MQAATIASTNRRSVVVQVLTTPDLFELFHDLLKVTALHAADGFVAGYLVAGAPLRLWTRPTTCADWFATEYRDTRTLDPVAFVDAHPRDWTFICARSAGRAHWVPSEVELTTIASVSIQVAETDQPPGPWSVRCVRAAPASSAQSVELPAPA